MGGRKEIENIFGQELGKKRSPRGPILDAFQERGVNIADATVGGLRDGRKNGNALADRLTANEILERRIEPKKNHFILKMSQTGLDLRSYQSGPNSHKLSSQGYVEEVAADAL